MCPRGIAEFEESFGIKNRNQCVGYYSNHDFEPNHGFFRDADGALIYPIDAPGTTATGLLGINNRGLDGWRQLK